LFRNILTNAVIDKITTKKQEPKTEEGKLANLSYIKDENKREVEAKKLGFELDRKLSNSEHTVLTKNGKTKVVFKGTSTVKDLIPDINIIRGKQNEDSSFIEAYNKTKQVQNKYGKDNVEIGSSHSLGGSKAIFVGKKLGIPYKALNPGITPFSKSSSKDSNVKSISGDIISGNFNILKDPISSHGIENF